MSACGACFHGEQVFDRILRSSTAGTRSNFSLDMSAQYVHGQAVKGVVSISWEGIWSNKNRSAWPASGAAGAQPKARLQDQFHEVCRFRHLTERTERHVWEWVRRFLVFQKQGLVWRHPREMGGRRWCNS